MIYPVYRAIQPVNRSGQVTNKVNKTTCIEETVGGGCQQGGELLKTLCISLNDERAPHSLKKGL